MRAILTWIVFGSSRGSKEIMMLGEQIGEFTGQTISTRVLEDTGLPPSLATASVISRSGATYLAGCVVLRKPRPTS
jgi:hypothetical protein